MKQFLKKKLTKKQINAQETEDTNVLLKTVQKSHSNLQIKPFRMLLCAQSGGGKTYLLGSFIKELIDRKYFKPNQIVWVSSTCDIDPFQIELIRDYKISKLDCAKESDFQKILVDRKAMLKAGKILSQKLFVFDDMISEEMMQNKNNFLKKFFTSGRHFLISSIILIQHLKSCPITIRQQCSNILIGNTPDRDKLEDWLNAYKGKLHKKEVIQLYDQARLTNDGYGFIHILTEKTGPEMFVQNLTVDQFL